MFGIRRFGISRFAAAPRAAVDTGAPHTVTWNPATAAQYTVLSNNNLTARGTAATGTSGVEATKIVTSGLHNWEIHFAGNASYHGAGIGISDGATFPYPATPGLNNSRGVTYHSNTSLFRGGVQEFPGLPPWEEAGSYILMVALDADNDLVWFGRNGVWFGGTPGVSGGFATGMSQYAAHVENGGNDVWAGTLKARASDLVYPAAGFAAYDTGAAPVVEKIYKGVKTLEQLLLGTKTEAQLYLGARDLI